MQQIDDNFDSRVTEKKVVKRKESSLHSSVEAFAEYVRLIEEKENLLAEALTENLELKKELTKIRKEKDHYQEQNILLNQQIGRERENHEGFFEHLGSVQENLLKSDSMTIDDEKILDMDWKNQKGLDLGEASIMQSHLVKKIREAAILRDVAGKQKDLILKLRATLRKMELALGEEEKTSATNPEIAGSSLIKIKKLLTQLAEEEIKETFQQTEVHNMEEISC